MDIIEKYLFSIEADIINFLENLSILGKYHRVIGIVLMKVDLYLGKGNCKGKEVFYMPDNPPALL